MMCKPATAAVLIFSLCLSCFAVERPFVMWSEADVAAIKKRIQTQDWAKAEYGRLVSNPQKDEKAFAILLRCAIEGDETLIRKEIDDLLRTARSPVPRGAAQYINVIRYDMFHDRLTPGERQEVEEFFRTYIDNIVFKRAIFDPEVFNDSRNYSRYDARVYSRSNWLPNIAWPWKVSANLMAAALQDEDLIRKVWSAYGSWQWYFDEYLCDIGFYAEEFSKMGSTPGAMLIYCRALERLGLNELGYGYTGKGQATMKGHIESLIHIGYPRIDLCSSRPQYPVVTMGDLRQSGSSQSWNVPAPAFQHSLVMGYLPDGRGGNDYWKAHGAWGGTRRGKMAQWDGYSGFTPKMQTPLWFEAGHARWPQVHFDYFLYQMRSPDEEKYYPSLYFGIDPVDASEAKAPAAPSAVWPDRGIVMLRSNQSSDYWESAAPAASMRLAADYAHNVNDSFALMGFYAFNRPIYINRQVTPGYAKDWSRSIQSHCGVTVDGREPAFTSDVDVTRAFTEPVKFISAASKEVYPGIELKRTLMLTRDYLFDVTELAGSETHDYYWFMHALGEVAGQKWKQARWPAQLEQLSNVRTAEADGKNWSVKAVQSCALDDLSEAKLPRQWYEREIGVHMTMLARKGMKAYIARTPLPIIKYRNAGRKMVYEKVRSEVGGVTILAAQKGTEATFASLYEPFESGQHRIVDVEKMADNQQALVVSVAGGPGSRINDRLMLSRVDVATPVKVVSGRQEYEFRGWGYLRIGNSEIEACGNITRLKLQVNGRPRFILNGRETDVPVLDGCIEHKPASPSVQR